ncbi:MAG: hypothetical protein ACKORF_00630 [Micrococcales bacterium]
MRKKAGCGGWALILVALWLVVSLLQSKFFVGLLVTAGLGFGLWWAYKKFWVPNKGSLFGGGKDKQYRAAQIYKLEALAANLPYRGPVSLALNKDEQVLYVLNSVGLLESRSNGSSYSGGSQGFSFRVAKGISYRVGGSRGQLVRNPETIQVIDTGSAVFTNQRVVFTGSSTNRQWDFSKLLNVDMAGNGLEAMIAVSNRQKTSGLQCLDVSDITPGMLLAIAIDWKEGGIERARRRAIDTAGAYRAIDAGDTEFNATQLANRAALEENGGGAAVVPPASAVGVSASAPAAKTDGLVLADKTDDDEPVEVVGESFNAENFVKLRKMLQVQAGDTETTQVDLVAEPFNKFSKNGHAVAVQKNGLILGHLSEEVNTEFFDLLKEYNGRGVCQAEIYFCPEGQNPPMNSVRLLCTDPPSAK